MISLSKSKFTNNEDIHSIFNLIIKSRIIVNREN